MTEQAKKLGIEETLDCMNFAIGAVTDLADHKADDGKIDLGEWAAAGMANAPGAMKAVIGIQNVDDEMKDLDEDEIKQLAAKGLELTQAIMSIFGVKKD